MECIRCHGDMEKRTLRGILVDYCIPCSAIWLDGGELEALAHGREDRRQELDAEARAEEAREGARPIVVLGLCPRCQQQLVPTSMGSVEVDRCGECGGIYFDRGELPRVLRLSRKTSMFGRIWDRFRPG